MSVKIKTLAEVTREHIERALFLSDGSATQAAKLLGVSRQTIYRNIDLAEIRKRIQKAKALSTPA